MDELIIKIIKDMYYTLFAVYTGNDYTCELPMPLGYDRNKHFANNSSSCPAEYIIVKALSIGQGAAETEETDLEKLWTYVKENRTRLDEEAKLFLRSSFIADTPEVTIKNELNKLYKSSLEGLLSRSDSFDSEAVTEKILEILPPENVIAFLIYSKFHTVYDEETFNAFCDVCGLKKPDTASTGMQAFLAIGEIVYSDNNVCDYARKLLKTCYNRMRLELIHKRLGNIRVFVYEDVIEISQKYSSFSYLIPSDKELLAKLTELFKENVAMPENNKDKINPKGPDNWESTDSVPNSKVEEYLETLKKLLKKKLIVKIGTTGDDRTLRRRIKVNIIKLNLQVPLGETKYTADACYCPDFLLDELRKVVDNLQNLKNNTDIFSVKNKGNFITIIIIMYAFSKENYDSPTGSKVTFEDVIRSCLNYNNNSGRCYLSMYKGIIEDKKRMDVIDEVLDMPCIYHLRSILLYKQR